MITRFVSFPTICSDDPLGSPGRAMQVCALSDAPLGDDIAVTLGFNVVVGTNRLGRTDTFPEILQRSLGTLHTCSLFP